MYHWLPLLSEKRKEEAVEGGYIPAQVGVDKQMDKHNVSVLVSYIESQQLGCDTVFPSVLVLLSFQKL